MLYSEFYDDTILGFKHIYVESKKHNRVKKLSELIFDSTYFVNYGTAWQMITIYYKLTNQNLPSEHFKYFAIILNSLQLYYISWYEMTFLQVKKTNVLGKISILIKLLEKGWVQGS